MAAKTRKAVSAKEGLENYRHPDLFGRLLGYRLSRIDRRKHTAEAELEVREEHLSPAGRVHGGVVSALFDYTCGAAVFTTLGPRDFCSTVELKVNYFRPLELGDTLVARAQVVFRGKRLCALHGYLYRNQDTAPVAMVVATFNIVAAQA